MRVEMTVIISCYLNFIIQWLFLSTTKFPFTNPIFCKILTPKREHFFCTKLFDCFVLLSEMVHCRDIIEFLYIIQIKFNFQLLIKFFNIIYWDTANKKSSEKLTNRFYYIPSVFTCELKKLLRS